MSTHNTDPAIENLITNFDHTHPDHATNWVDTYDQLRAKCPIGKSENHGGYWVTTRFKDVMSVAQASTMSAEKEYDPDKGILKGGNIIPPFPVDPVFPVEAGASEWRGYRTFLNRRFSPASAELRRPVAKAIARSLVDRVIETGRIDFVEDLTSPLPALVTMDMFGFDLAGWTDFAEPIHKYMYLRPEDPEYMVIAGKLGQIIELLGREAHDRQRAPRDDLMSYIANGEIDSKPLTEFEITQLSLNLVFGGVDTTTALTSNMFRHLGTHFDDRRRLIADPEMRRRAREECVRFYAPVHGVARTATADTEIDGRTIKAGERVFLAIASANRDPAVFEQADTFVVDRNPNRHMGFGAGMHHCIGLFVARVMFDAMLDEVLERLPDYRLLPGEVPYGSVDKVNGWAHLPAEFTPGRKLGGGMAI